MSYAKRKYSTKVKVKQRNYMCRINMGPKEYITRMNLHVQNYILLEMGLMGRSLI